MTYYHISIIFLYDCFITQYSRDWSILTLLFFFVNEPLPRTFLLLYWARFLYTVNDTQTLSCESSIHVLFVRLYGNWCITLCSFKRFTVQFQDITGW